MSLVVGATSLAGDRERLAREPGSDEIHATGEEPGREARQIAPDRSLVQPSVLHRLNQSGDGEGFPLHVHDRASVSAACDLDSEVETSDSGAERNDVEGR